MNMLLENKEHVSFNNSMLTFDLIKNTLCTYCVLSLLRR